MDQLYHRWMQRDPCSLRSVRPEMWLLPRYTFVSFECGCRSLKAVAASTESSVNLLLVAIRVSTMGICETRCSRWSISASTNWHLIMRTVLTVASAYSPISFRDRKQHAKLVLEASPPISSITSPVFAVLLLSSNTDYITFLLPQLFMQTFDCLNTSQGMQLSKAGRWSSRRPISLLSCYPKRSPTQTDDSIVFKIDREIRDLLKTLSRLWHNSLGLLVLDARSRLLEVPHILDLSILDALEQLLDCMFSFQRRPNGDLLTDFSISPFFSPSRRPFSDKMCFTSYFLSWDITSNNSFSRSLPS